MNLKTKLTLGFLAVASLIVLLGGINSYFLSGIREDAGRIAESNIGEVKHTANLTVLVGRINGGLKRFFLDNVLEQDQEIKHDHDSLLADLDELDSSIEELRKSTESGIELAGNEEDEKGEEDEKAAIEELTIGLEKYDQLVRDVMAKVDSGDVQGGIDQYFSFQKEIELLVTDGTHELYNDAVKEIEEEAENVIAAVYKALIFTLCFTAVALVVSLLLAKLLSKNILSRILTLERGAGAIEKGDFSVTLDKGNSRDELATLIDRFNHMAKKLQSSTASIEDLNAEVSRRKETEVKLQSSHDRLEERVVERTHLLEETMLEAENANRSKSEFLANMSHELRTPLNHIIGFSELVVDERLGPLNETQKEYIGDAVDSGRHLLTLINDILDLSKVEAGKMELQLSEIDLEEMLEKCRTIFREKTLRHNIDLQLVTENIPDKVLVDEIKVKQVLFNLISNAVKFSPDGERIEISAKRQESSPNITVSVVDNGIGIPPEDLEKVFNPFEQSKQYGKQQGGTGLGLALVKRFVELHGGNVVAESEGEGQGARFSFSLPCGDVV